MTVPVDFSLIMKTKGLSTVKLNTSGTEVRAIPTDVTAAASVPSSFVSMKVLCFISDI